nr:MAG: putative RNA-dependent RNA polymerase [Narnaviridae sp.]
MSTTAGDVSVDVSTFEDAFLLKAFFLGENRLDRVLYSLLHLLDVCAVYQHRGLTYLINRENLRRRIRDTCSKSISIHLSELLKVQGRKFNYLDFCLANGINLDLICGTFPLKFKNFRFVSHCLRISYSIYLTFRMHGLFGKVKTRQRKRGGRLEWNPGNLFSKIFIHFLMNLKNCKDESELIKTLKNSLCYYVSEALEQEEKPEKTFPLFPSDLQYSILKIFDGDKVKYSNFAFSCLQSKALCEEVPSEFVQTALEKHAAQLTSEHKGVSSEALNALRERGRKFGKLVKRFYNPDKGFFPSNHASFHFTRDSGGVKGDLVYNERLTQTPLGYYCDPDDRPEPFVIGLFGQPAMGKSTRLNHLISLFSTVFPGVSRTNLVYQRTCHVEHWDGYHGQPIVILDDLGQSAQGADLKEFQTLVSCCPYVLPMAHLEQKGMKFSSPVIITTSNLLYGSVLEHTYKQDKPIIDDASFWRRFHLPIYIEDNVSYRLKEEPCWVRTQNLMIKVLKSRRNGDIDLPTYYSHQTTFASVNTADGIVYKQDIWREFPENEYSCIIDTYKTRMRFHSNFSHCWRQDLVNKIQDTSCLDPLLSAPGLDHITSLFPIPDCPDFRDGTGQTKTIIFPSYPPLGPLPVRVEPICEPLKVRIITAGLGDTFCLKPLQVAMWKALGIEPQFSLTHGKSLEGAINRIYESSSEEDVWISGDYTAATDSFSIEASRALMEGILESIDHEPTKRWAMKEVSGHLLIYPNGSGISPRVQKSGQLMGSLLSFPLLCLLNDCTAQSVGLKPHQYLINGDDIIMRAPANVYTQWKEQVHDFGLTLSLGKNYIHKRFGTVNSQFVCDGQVLSSGKQRILDRRTHVLGQCLRDLELNMGDNTSEEIKDLFKSVNRAKLSRTVRSIHVPQSHGGLGFSWGVPLKDIISRKTARLCYLNDLFRKIRPKKGYLSVPYLSHEKESINELKSLEESFNASVSSKEFHEDFLTPVDIALVRKRSLTHQDLRWCLFDSELEDLPALTFLHTYEIPFTDERIRKELQKEIDHLFLERFLRKIPDFGYAEYRKAVLDSIVGLKDNMTKSVNQLVGLMDLNVKPDYIKLINLDYKSKSFNRAEFEGSLPKALKPKEFNLDLEDIDFEDFSQEVTESCQQVLGLWFNLSHYQEQCLQADEHDTEEAFASTDDQVSTDLN